MPPHRFLHLHDPPLHALGREAAVVTIGNYDGLHLGHQAVLHAQRALAARLSLPTVALIFEPQPREYFEADSAPPRLTCLREKVLLLRGLGIDRIVCLRFGPALAALAPEDFVARILIGGLGARGIVVGDDFRFGRQRRGDTALLCALGQARGVEVVRVAACERDGVRVSSTRVREALLSGDMAAASRFLGRPYALYGRVVHGDRRGRILGYPTANIPLRRRAAAVCGIFAARVRGLASRALPAVAYIGPGPARGGARALLEVHLLDHEADLYGLTMWVDLLHRIREDRSFATAEALRAQIALDVAEARRLWAEGPLVVESEIGKVGIEASGKDGPLFAAVGISEAGTGARVLGSRGA